VQLQSHHKKTLRRISLTPLADLVFILLVFFILETSFTEYRQMGFNVPEKKEESTSAAGELLSLQLFEDGRLWVQGEAIVLQDLGIYLAGKKFDAETAVVIEVHGRAPLQLLVNTMDQLKSHTLEKIQILPLDKEKPTSKNTRTNKE
jgi:biopolymer transport protein ExbD